MEDNKTLEPLNAEEQRILGVLIEKSKTTPDYYPMSINAIMLACNQKTSRNPVVNYDEETITLTLNALKIKGLVGTATGAGTRSTKYKHNLAIKYPLLPKDLTLLALLFLRGPLTPGELNTYSARMSDFESIEEVVEILQQLAHHEPPYVKQLQKKTGQKEVRFMQLFGGDMVPEPIEEEKLLVVQSNTLLAQRVEKLEQELEELKEMVNLLMNG
ncbi:YceH family protein [Pedobacter sp.]|uniref:YceH family protein n=1 Tax=Pedobacter sp. TaxID=1411316 RepID=UPI003D7F25FC